MDNQRAPVFALRIAAIIIGATMFKQFDFQSLKFEKPALGMVYLVTFVFIVYVLIKDVRRKQ